MIDFLKEDIFLVTGASSGIGRAIAQKLNERGATVVTVARSIDKLEETKRNSKYPENVFLEPKDLTENIEKLPFFIKNLKEKYGKLKGLVCAAGIDNPITLSLVDYQKAQLIFNINYYVPLMLAKGFADKRNHTSDASIVFIASVAGVYPDKGQLLYASTKAALIAASKIISKEYSKNNLRVNCISPAEVETPMYLAKAESIGSDVQNYPLGIGQPEDIANMAAFLLSKEARWITGQNYIMDGGVF
jgi:NAD(P)-dependent dehydrogenase (short-subunit alcohol dehydrogenase family)